MPHVYMLKKSVLCTNCKLLMCFTVQFTIHIEKDELYEMKDKRKQHSQLPTLNPRSCFILQVIDNLWSTYHMLNG